MHCRSIMLALVKIFVIHNVSAIAQNVNKEQLLQFGHIVPIGSLLVAFVGLYLAIRKYKENKRKEIAGKKIQINDHLNKAKDQMGGGDITMIVPLEIALPTESKNLEAAKRELDCALILDERNVETLRLYGHYFLKMGQLEKAILNYGKTLRMDPKCAPAHNGLGVALKIHGNIEKAILHFKKAFELDIDYFWPLINLGNTFFDLGRLDDAYTEYQKAISKYSYSIDGHIGLGNVYVMKNEYEKAEEAYRTALSFNPNECLALLGLANCSYYQDKTPEAISLYLKAIASDPNNASAYAGLANALCKNNQVKEAIEMYTKAIELRPKESKFYILLGDIHNHVGNRNESINAYRKAIRFHPSYTSICEDIYNLAEDFSDVEIDLTANDVLETFSVTIPLGTNVELKQEAILAESIQAFRIKTYKQYYRKSAKNDLKQDTFKNTNDLVFEDAHNLELLKKEIKMYQEELLKKRATLPSIIDKGEIKRIR